jgi:AmiR/NasT family two-component response regulator
MKRRRALVAEDEALIAADLEDMLDNAGFDVVGPCATLVDAQERMLDEQPDVAIVDMRLRDDSADALIDNLRLRHIPLVIVSGLWPPDSGSRYEGLTWLSKPVDRSDLLHAIDDAMCAS